LFVAICLFVGLFVGLVWFGLVGLVWFGLVWFRCWLIVCLCVLFVWLVGCLLV